MTRATLEYLDGLSSHQVFIHMSSFRTVRQFASEQLAGAVGRMTTNGLGEQVMDPYRIILRNELIDLTAQLDIGADMDLAELYALGVMNATNRCAEGFFTGTQLVLRRAITERVHSLMEMRPELIHPNLRVAKNAAEGETWLLRFLVTHRVALDPERLVRMAQTPGVGRDVLHKALQHGKSFGGDLLEEAMRAEMGCASTALAIVLADEEVPEFDDHHVQQMWTLCAAGAAKQQWQFDRAIDFLRAVRRRQDAAGGDGHRAPWPQGPELLECTDLAWASARGAHPVLGLLYETAVRASFVGDCRKLADVAGFPATPLATAAAALNDVLEPQARLPLESLSGLDILKMTVLCPKACENGPVGDFWTRERSADIKNTPSDILDWAIDRPDSSGEYVALSFLDSRAEDFVQVMGPEHFNELRAKVTKQMMASAIEASSPAGQPEQQAARRRARVL